MKKIQNKGVVIYQAKSGAIELRGDFTRETLWATQAQIAEIFGTQRPAITKHLRNIFIDGELKEKSVSSILEHTATDEKTYISTFFYLDLKKQYTKNAHCKSPRFIMLISKK